MAGGYPEIVTAPDWFVVGLGWKAATAKTTKNCLELFGEAHGPNLADLHSKVCAYIAGQIYSALKVPTSQSAIDLADPESEKKSSGSWLETQLTSDLEQRLQQLAPDRDFRVAKGASAGRFAPFLHLAELQKLFETNPMLRGVLGGDYQISTDVMVSLPDPFDASRPRILHAAVSSKLTIRSDRAQNIRQEFGVLVRHRRGRLPHLVAVTADPLPSRLVSLARGTGEIDAVYHLLFDEIDAAMNVEVPSGVNAKSWNAERQCWAELTGQGRLKPYSELALTLAAL